jgi:hypothetical protein
LTEGHRQHPLAGCSRWSSAASCARRHPLRARSPSKARLHCGVRGFVWRCGRLCSGRPGCRPVFRASAAPRAWWTPSEADGEVPGPQAAWSVHRTISPSGALVGLSESAPRRFSSLTARLACTKSSPPNVSKRLPTAGSRARVRRLEGTARERRATYRGSRWPALTHRGGSTHQLNDVPIALLTPEKWANRPVLTERGDSNPRWTETPIPVFETGALGAGQAAASGSIPRPLGSLRPP